MSDPVNIPFNKNPMSGGRQTAQEELNRAIGVPGGPAPVAPQFEPLKQAAPIDYSSRAFEAVTSPALPIGIDYAKKAQEVTSLYRTGRAANEAKFPYMTPVNDNEYGIINRSLLDIEANGGDVTAASYKWATAVEMSRFFGRPINNTMENLDTFYRAWTGRDFTPTQGNFEAITDSFRIGLLNDKLGTAAGAWRNAGGGEQGLEEVRALKDQIDALADNAPRNWFVTALKYGAQSAPFTVKTMVAGAVAGAAVAGIASGVGAAPGTVALLKAGASLAGSFATSANTMAALDYLEMRDMGVSHDIAVPISTGTGVIAGVIEAALGNVAGMAGKLGGLDSIAGNVAKKFLISGQSGALAKGLVRYIGETAEEGVEEFLQQVVVDVGKNIAAGLEDNGIEQMSASEIAKDAAQAFVGGVAGAVFMGLPGAMIGYKGDVKTSKALKEFAGNARTKEAFIEAASKWESIKDVPETGRAEALGTIWDKAQKKIEKVAEAKDEAGITEVTKPYERTNAGTLYTQETTRESSEEGQQENVFMVGDGKTADRLGYLVYTFDDKTGITIKESKFEAGYKGLREEAIQELAAKYQGIEINVAPTADAATRRAVEAVAAQNPRGADKGAQIYGTMDNIEDVKAAQKFRDAINKNMPNVTPSQRETAIVFMDAFAKGNGRTFAEVLGTFSDEIISPLNEETAPDVMAKAREKGVTARAAINYAGTGQIQNAAELINLAKATIYISERADFASLIHELGHGLKRALSKENRATIDEVFGIIGDVWTEQQEEDFTNQLTKYLTYGELKDERLRGIFQQIGEWIKKIYDNVLSTMDDLDPRIREAMGKLFKSEKSPIGEKAVAEAQAKETETQEEQQKEEDAKTQAVEGEELSPQEAEDMSLQLFQPDPAARSVEKIAFKFPKNLIGYSDIHSQSQISGVLTSFGRGVSDRSGEDIRIGGIGESHIGLARGIQDAKRFYYGYDKASKTVFVVAKNGMDDSFIKNPKVLKMILSNVFDKFRLSTVPGKRMTFESDTTLFQSDPWIYKTEEIINQKMQGPMPGKNILAMLKGAGVKADELEWTGLDTYLDTDAKRTPAEVKEYLEGNKLEIQEVTKGAPKLNKKSKYYVPEIKRAIKDAGDSPGELTLIIENDGDVYRALMKKFPELEEDELWAETVTKSIFGTETKETKFDNYVIPNGDNYRELLFIIPKQAPYSSPHWDESNVLAHTRLNDRTVDGKRMLFIEEIQSDQHQDGRKHGYLIDNEKIREELQARISEIEAKGRDATETEKAEWAELMNKRQPYLAHIGVPDAPFKKTWHEFVFKRILRAAVENGYDTVGWTTGEQQGSRYSEDNHGPKDQARTAGMKGFYDKMLVDYANKYAKKWGVKVEDAQIDIGKGWQLVESGTPAAGRSMSDKTFSTEAEAEAFAESEKMTYYAAVPQVEGTVHSLPITPEMSESIGEGQVLFQPDPEIINAEARSFDSWEAWKADVEAGADFLGDQSSKPALTGAEADAWYKSTWEAATKKPASSTRQATSASGDFTANMSAPDGIESFLEKIWDATLRFQDKTLAMDEEEQAELDASYEWAKELDHRLQKYPLVYNAAQKYGAKGELDPNTRAKILGFMRNNEVAFKELYADLTGDDQIKAEVEQTLKDIPAPERAKWASMGIAEKTAVLNAIKTKEVRQKIEKGTYSDAELKDYSRIVEKDLKALKEEVKAADEKIKELGNEIYDEKAEAWKQYLKSKDVNTANTDALKSAREEAALQTREKEKEIRALHKLRAQRDALRKSIMRKPSANTINYDERKQIEILQEYLAGKKWEWFEEVDEFGETHMRRAYDTNIDMEGNISKKNRHTSKDVEGIKSAGSQFMRDSPALAKFLAENVIDRINNKPVGAWSVAELKELYDIIENLKAVGRAKRSAKLEEQRAYRADKIAEVNEIVRTSKNFQDPAGYGSEEAKKITEKLEKKNLLNTAFINMRRFAQIYLDSGVDGINTELLVMKERKAYNAQMKNQNERIEKVTSYMKEIGYNEKELRESVNLGNIGPNDTSYTVKKSDLMAISLAILDHDSKAAFIFGNLFSYKEREDMTGAKLLEEGKRKLEVVKKAAMESLSEKEKQIVSKIGADFNDNFDRLNLAIIGLTNKELKKVANYFPIHRAGNYFDHFGSDTVNVMNKILGMPSVPEKGFSIERIEISAKHQVPITLDLFATWQKAVEHQEHLIAYGEYIQMVNSVYKSKQSGSAREAIEQAYGKPGITYIDEYLAEIANPGMDKAKNDSGTKLLKILRGNMAVGFLAFRWTSVVKQIITSPLPFMAYAPGGTTAAAFDLMKSGHPMKWLAQVESQSQWLKNRTIDQVFQTIKEMGDTGYEAVVKKIGTVGMKGLEFADRFSVAIGWKGVYDQSIAKGMTEEEAVAHADDVAMKTQPSARGADQSPVFRNSSEWSRLLLQFGSALNVVFQNIYYDVPAAIRNKEYLNAIGIMASYAMGGILLGALAKATGKDAEDDPDEKWKLWAYYSMTQFSDSVPLIGQEISGTAKRFITGDKGMKFGKEILPTFGAIQSGFEELTNGKIVDSAGSFAEALGLTLGLPVLASKEILGYGKDILGGE